MVYLKKIKDTTEIPYWHIWKKNRKRLSRQQCDLGIRCLRLRC
jgi:hypothetical protein